MPDNSPALDLSRDAVALTADLVDVYSESGHEGRLADQLQTTLEAVPHLAVERHGDAVIARTMLDRPQRIVIAGHIDTVPPGDNLPSRADGDRLFGLGTSDMKSGLAVMLRLAAQVTNPTRDLTYVFYDGEEVSADRNGMGRLAREQPHLLAGDFAVLMEPTNGLVEGGCQGSIRADIHVPGTRAHSARSWLGDNAIHAASPVLQLLADYQPREPIVDGFQFREGLNAVGISGGVAGNVIPDVCVVTVNYRFAPDLSEADALAVLERLFDGYELTVVDSSAAARPALEHDLARDLVQRVGRAPQVKFGWTDVARFAALGIPAVNYGPGDPGLSHTRHESVEVSRIGECERVLLDWLTVS